MQAKIKDAKARQHAIVVRGKAAQTRLGVRRQLNDHNVDDAMRRFDLYERKMDDLEGQVESYDLGQRTLADEIEDLEKDEQVEEQLAELKSGISAGRADPAETGDQQGAGAAGR